MYDLLPRQSFNVEVILLPLKLNNQVLMTFMEK